MPVSYSTDAAVAAPKVTFAPESPSMDTELSLRGHRKRASGSNVLAAANSPMKRSISTPVVSSPAMISSEQAAEFEKQRQALVMMTTYIASAIQEMKRGDPIKYEELIAQLTVTKPSPLTPTKLLQWIQALSQCISLLDKSCSALIDAMLQTDWLIQDDVFVQYYLSFLGNVVSAHAFYVVPVQSMLVHKLTHRYKPAFTGDVPTINRDAQHERVHQALKYILGLIPTGATSLFPLLATAFPHKRESIYAHTMFVKNILRVLEYAPVLRTQILGLVIDRIIQVDVEIQVELEELEDSDTEVAYDFDTVDDEDSDDSDSDSEDDSDSDSDGPQVAVMDIKEMTKKLDGMLFLVFAYLEGYVNSCRHLPSVDGRMPAPVEQLYIVLLQIFMGTILQTFKSRHTQFILFYIASLSPKFSDYFLGALVTKILDKSQPEVIRVSAAAYISSFVARAKYLELPQVLLVIDMLSNFALELVAQVDTGSNVLPDADRYAVFYAVVQALMYIFCFRWRVLEVGAESKNRSSKDDFDSAGMIVGSMDSPDVNNAPRGVGVGGRQWHAGLASLQRVVTSRLNPLKMCSSNVVKQFARISQSLDFMYIYPILEQNKKIYIPRHTARPDSDGGSRNGAGGGQVMGGQLPHELETFFPFDPYRLRQSAPFMQGIYQEWENEEDDEEDEEDEDEYDEYDEEEAGEFEEDEDLDVELHDIGRHNGSMSSEDEDEDEDEAEMNKSIMAMSISPSPAHFLVQGVAGRK
ncbi:MAG: RNA polymerase I-specific transcription initiation factor RRN3-domain-containing protein [Linnemannia gamsii]|nr:MAG: RNA polymerase I-specific transcription initiation factor RRN3-domain-containing protein [Linnemannia gamsii]